MMNSHRYFAFMQAFMLSQSLRELSFQTSIVFLKLFFLLCTGQKFFVDVTNAQ